MNFNRFKVKTQTSEGPMKRILLVTTCLLASQTAMAQATIPPSPAYQECTSLATSNPAQTLTKAEYDALMVGRDRPLTQQPMQRHTSGHDDNLTGDFQ